MEEDVINIDYLMGGWDINRWVGSSSSSLKRKH